MPRVTALLLLLIAQVSVAQLRFNSLDEIIKYADKNHPVLSKAQLLEEVSLHEMQEMRSALRPRINLVAETNYYPVIASVLVPGKMLGGNDDKLTRVQLGLPFTTTAGVEFSIPVLAFDKWAQVKKAQLENIRTHYTQKVFVEQFHIELTQVYYQLIAWQELLALNKENETTVAAFMQILDQRYKEGVLDPTDHNRAKNLQLEVIYASVTYQDAFNEALINLQSMLNLRPNEAIVVSTLKTFEWPLLEQAWYSITRRAAFQETSLKISSARQSLQISKKASLPRLTAYGRYTGNWHMKFGSQSQQVYFNASAIGLKLDIPLFTGGFYKSQRLKSSLLAKVAMAEQVEVISRLQKERALWINGYETALKKKTILDNKVSLANANLRIANLQLEEAVIEFDQYNAIFLENTKARLEVLQNLFEGMMYTDLLIRN